jgi:hypothetical protein
MPPIVHQRKHSGQLYMLPPLRWQRRVELRSYELELHAIAENNIPSPQTLLRSVHWLCRTLNRRHQFPMIVGTSRDAPRPFRGINDIGPDMVAP